MSVASLQAWSQAVIALGLVLAALGGFGSYYYGKKAGDNKALQLRTKVDELLVRSQTLEEKLEPFQQLAKTARPDLDQDAALDSLRQEIERLRKIAGKHEFTPLEPQLRATLIQRIREFASDFADAGISIKVTHETWARPATKQYASQLVELLEEGGLRVHGPDQITYFLVTPASPLEWGYNEVDVSHVEMLYRALLFVIRPNPEWTKASHQEPGSVRIHFGGEARFEPNGVVTIL